jgi:hypothetical protein
VELRTYIAVCPANLVVWPWGHVWCFVPCNLLMPYEEAWSLNRVRLKCHGMHSHVPAGTAADSTEDVVEKVPFLVLAMDLPPAPLYKDALEKNIIPQVMHLSALCSVYTTNELVACSAVTPFAFDRFSS